jgi:hypothetical protein
MKTKTMRRAATAALALMAGSLSACFTMTHEFPANTTFGGASLQSPPVRTIEDSSMKNWLIAGLIPWSKFDTDDMVGVPPKGQHVAVSEVDTTFNELDTLIWIVPGQFYGYYVWAPRHVGVKAKVVKDDAAVIPARR